MFIPKLAGDLFVMATVGGAMAAYPWGISCRCGSYRQTRNRQDYDAELNGWLCHSINGLETILTPPFTRGFGNTITGDVKFHQNHVLCQKTARKLCPAGLRSQEKNTFDNKAFEVIKNLIFSSKGNDLFIEFPNILKTFPQMKCFVRQLTLRISTSEHDEPMAGRYSMLQAKRPN
uniref:Uncharacterized protein n=1 Tax=Glossina austeni TaxID=7395 RepID=A0A1A9V994_GLOAU